MSEEAVGPLVLDTHVWIWTIDGARSRLNEAAASAIERGSRRGELMVSAISVWEVAMLESRGRISFTRPLRDWIRTALRAPGLRLLPLEPEIAIESTRLSGKEDRDAVDRILIASARAAGGRLVTCDASLISYARQGHLGVLDARVP